MEIVSGVNGDESEVTQPVKGVRSEPKILDSPPTLLLDGQPLGVNHLKEETFLDYPPGGCIEEFSGNLSSLAVLINLFFSEFSKPQQDV